MQPSYSPSHGSGHRFDPCVAHHFFPDDPHLTRTTVQNGARTRAGMRGQAGGRISPVVHLLSGGQA